MVIGRGQRGHTVALPLCLQCDHVMQLVKSIVGDMIADNDITCHIQYVHQVWAF